MSQFSEADRQRVLRMVEETVSAEKKDAPRVLAVFAECAQLGIDALPVDINQSDDQCGFEGEGGIRLGFSAISGKREQFINDLLAERQKKGAFRAFQDFCERNDLEAIPAEFFRKCVAGGVFDAIEPSRAALFAGYEKIIDAVRKAKADRASGQFGLFAMLPAATPLRPISLPQVESWTEDEMIEREKAALGFSFTEYQRLQHQSDDEGDTDAAAADEPVETPAPQEAQPMPSPPDSSTEAAPEILSDAQPPASESAEAAVEPAASIQDEMPPIPADLPEGPPIEDDIALAPEPPYPTAVEPPAATPLTLHLAANSTTAAMLLRLRELLELHPGAAPVVLAFTENGQEIARIKAHDDYCVRVSDELLARIEGVIGQK